MANFVLTTLIPSPSLA